MRKGLILFALIAALDLQSPQHVDAVTGFATEVTQLLNHAQLVLQYTRQGEQLANEIKIYENMLLNSKPLDSHAFGAIAADLGALAQVVQGGHALAYSLANLDTQFRNTYPGYAYNSANYYQQYRLWSQTSLDTTLGVLRAAGLQGQQLQSEQGIISALRSALLGTNGQLMAVHAMADISEQQVEGLQKLRELMIADITSKQAYQATIIQHQAATEAAAERYFNYVPPISDGQTFGPGWH